MIKSRERGVTLIEMLMAVAVGSVLLLVMGQLILTSTRASISSDVRSRADTDLRYALDKVETDLMNCSAFQVARSTEVLFLADSSANPSYQPYADFDGDGIPNIQDPDDDNDAALIRPPTAQWAIGYDLKDDDDNNDGQVDLRLRIYLTTATRILSKDYSVNGQAWGSNRVTLLERVVSTTVFSFAGSKDSLLSQNGAALDTNSDGMVSAGEIDAAANGGNGNSVIDTSTETARIVTVAIALDKDENRDKTLDSKLSTEIIPPSLYLKRRP